MLVTFLLLCRTASDRQNVTFGNSCLMIAVVFACQETCGPHGRAYQVPGMSFDRIGNLGKSSTMKARLQEEVRLVEIAQGTRVRYTEMGVFSAVAGNQ